MNKIVDIVFDIISTRRSTRNFNKKKIDEEIVKKIIESGVQAPSAGNIDNIRYLIISDPLDIDVLGKIRWIWPYGNQQKFKNKFKSGLIGKSNLAVLIFSDESFLKKINKEETEIWEIISVENAATAIQNMLLISTALKLGSCYLSCNEKMLGTRLLKNSYKDFINKFNVPHHYAVRGIVIFGYPKKTDKKGFPAGEIRHGKELLNVKNKIKNIESYLINKYFYDKKK